MKTRFVAEVSSNHHQDLGRCKRFIEASAEIGCQAVKFQLFKIDQLFAPEILENNEAVHKRRQWELPTEFLPELVECCKKNNIEFSCTPFYLEAVDELAPFVDFYKVASYELLWDDLLVACAKTQKPLVLSTGMANFQEIDHAVEVITKAGCKDLTILHCVSAYPTPVDECNLAVMGVMRERYAQAGVKVGWSDHSVSPGVIVRACQQWQADFIEFHLDLDGEGEEFAAGHCWLPEQMKNTIAVVNEGLIADGDGKNKIAKSELPDRDWRADPSDGLRPLKAMRKTFTA